MGVMLALALQAASATSRADSIPADFDIRRYRHSEGDPCVRSTDSQTITVCARRGHGDYPMAEMDRRYADHPIRAETRLTGNLMGDAHVESAQMPDGTVSNRVMARLRLPF